MQVSLLIIGEIETGKRFPSVNMIEKIADALETESWHLFKNEPVNRPKSKQLQKLAPTQKEEITKMTLDALTKILNQF